MNPVNPVIERIYVKGKLKLDSPLILGSGENINTDIDLMRNWDGEPFIPGTSLAGVSRHYLLSLGISAIEELFGGKRDDSRISPIIFYDMPLSGQKQNVLLSFRDGVSLDETTKTAKDKEKFDYEILEPGCEFDFRLETVIRENNKKDDIIQAVDCLIQGLMKGEIRCGRKIGRGFGKILLSEADKLVINTKTDAKKWLEFGWDKDNIWRNAEKINSDPNSFENNNIIRAKFTIPGSIIIRHYSSDPKAPDSVHLKSAENSVIPGTSWAGVLRHTALRIGRQLGKEKLFRTLSEDIFGYTGRLVKDKSGAKKKLESRASRVIIEESKIERGVDFDYSRNKIDRFTGGTVDSALFTEMPHFGGKTSLEIRFRDLEKHEIAVILLALKDIGNGISPVGGEANIGRGILKEESISVMIKPPDDNIYDSCMQALAKWLESHPDEKETLK